jgi:EAL domain-containing protein (putative c-di-GMP-specific phosphodiesterase class I)
MEQSAVESNAATILVVDDDEAIGEYVVAAAEGMGFNCTATTNGTDFVAALNPEVSLILVDLMMPGMDGIEVLRYLGQQQCKAGVVLMSGFDRRVLATAEALAESLDLTMEGCLQKPFRLVELEAKLRSHTSRYAKPESRHASAIEVTEAQLRGAIERKEFVVYYQPQIDIASGQVVGLEALVRWQHPEHGLVFPDAFIGRAEALGMIDQIFWLVAKRALRETGLIKTREGKSPTLSLNVSPSSLHDLSFPERFVALALILEVPMSGLFKELSSALDILIRLRMQRVKLSIDDFGTGYAMMQQLRNVPATELKIDKSFVQDMHAKEASRVMVRKTIELGHELGMHVIAEGVETAEQLDYLRENGCDLAQGYYFCKPVPPLQLAIWLQSFP